MRWTCPAGEGELLVSDVLFVLLTLLVFAALGVLARGVERL